MGLQHIAIVPDGNRRWAQLHRIPDLEGHQAGADAMHRVVEQAIKSKLKYLTIWGFSSDNWKRDEAEVESLFQVLTQWLKKDAPWLNSEGVRLRYIGRFGELPQYLKPAIQRALALTLSNEGLTLTLAFNYSGRVEIIDAIHKWLSDATAPSYLDEAVFSHYLYTDGMPDVDLVIRTAGEFRLSNFLLWQTAYSEFYFTPVLWPDFKKSDFRKALSEFADRKRRFGGD
ncbi:Ditrans,polycis-undecaprenyl-diphosphate synthase ((2E,6E)-farnesyl-diphosphate specific) [subsurface metagenome]